jgi:signal recognition particle GTPase
VLTKLDGTAKGGVAVAVVRELDVPIRYVGVGEQLDDLLPFDAAGVRRRASWAPERGALRAASGSTSG